MSQIFCLLFRNKCIVFNIKKKLLPGYFKIIYFRTIKPQYFCLRLSRRQNFMLPDGQAAASRPLTVQVLKTKPPQRPNCGWQTKTEMKVSTAGGSLQPLCFFRHRKYQVVFCYTIIERNNRHMLPVVRSSAAGDCVTTNTNPLDSFFPFDPYLLKK